MYEYACIESADFCDTQKVPKQLLSMQCLIYEHPSGVDQWLVVKLVPKACCFISVFIHADFSEEKERKIKLGEVMKERGALCCRRQQEERQQQKQPAEVKSWC